MATNIKYEPGWSLNLTCTTPDEPNSGDPVRIGNLTGIALTDEDAAGKTVVQHRPVRREILRQRRRRHRYRDRGADLVS